MREVMQLIGIGVVSGVPAALGLTHMVWSQFFGLLRMIHLRWSGPLSGLIAVALYSGLFARTPRQ